MLVAILITSVVASLLVLGILTALYLAVRMRESDSFYIEELEDYE